MPPPEVYHERIVSPVGGLPSEALYLVGDPLDAYRYQTSYTTTQLSLIPNLKFTPRGIRTRDRPMSSLLLEPVELNGHLA